MFFANPNEVAQVTGADEKLIWKIGVVLQVSNILNKCIIETLLQRANEIFSFIGHRKWSPR